MTATTETGELGMKNHVTDDGLLAADQGERPIYHRDQDMILQGACLAEPRVDLIIPGWAENPGFVQLDVTHAHALMTALTAFLQDAQGNSAWRYDGIHYDLDKAWEGRPESGYQGLWFRHTGEFYKNVPQMRAEPEPGQVYYVPLPIVLGLKRCPVHNIWSAPCHECTLDAVRALYDNGDTDPMRGE
jgi:hypothetical protein